MAVPKRKTSPSKRGMRRSHDTLKAINVIENQTSGEYQLSHHMTEDGYYNGKQVLVKKKKKADHDHDHDHDHEHDH